MAQATFPCQHLHTCNSNRTVLINEGSQIFATGITIKPGRKEGVGKNHNFSAQYSVKCLVKRQKKLCLIAAISADGTDSIAEVPSLSDVIKKFYISINEKSLENLEDLISSDCLVEDSTFPCSFKGRKEVMSFFSEVVEAMGEHVRFRIGTVCEGDELTASVEWHLEWKKDQIPFSRGCSIFQCSTEDDRLVIRKAQIITESPIKPGKLALGLLKILASLFDDYPKAAKWFLKRPQTILQVLLNIYSVFFSPLVKPVLKFYITLWKINARVLGYVISILHLIAKLFNKKSSNGGSDDSDLMSE